MNATQRLARGRAPGFSLMELMVGLTIGMIATIIIIQVMSFFEAQRRATSGTADAQTNGGIALYAISRDLQMAGYPLMSTDVTPLGCTAVTSNVAGLTASINPVAVTDGAAGATPASDTITIRYGTTLTGGAPTQIQSVQGGNVVVVASNLACQANDITLVLSGSNCAISRATAVSATGVSPISVTLENAALATGGANLSCLGTWNEISYRVDGATGNLERRAIVSGVDSGWVPMIAGIVNLQVQYGISATAASNQITSWVDASGGTWSAPSVANRNRIKAVRIAVIARNARLEREVVSAACSSTTAAATGVCAWEGTAGSPAPTVDLSTNHANWSKYRYRTFETIIPLRNVIWSKDAL
jgi:type IV pilus assembly protein PilW